jgi:hypothetical protein
MRKSKIWKSVSTDNEIMPEYRYTSESYDARIFFADNKWDFEIMNRKTSDVYRNSNRRRYGVTSIGYVKKMVLDTIETLDK